MVTISKFVIFFGIAILVCTANPTIKVSKCTAEDLKCLKNSAQELIPVIADGIPEYKMEKLDPLVFKDDLDASIPNLSLKAKNIVVTGLKGCTAEKIERDVANSKIRIRLLCTIHFQSEYEMHGQFLLVPMEGKGDCHAHINKIQLDIENDMSDKTGKDGKKHWHINKSRFTFELKDTSSVKFENLFDGNEELARAANDIIGKNTNIVIKELGPPVFKAIVDNIVKSINKFYKAVPAEEIALD